MFVHYMLEHFLFVWIQIQIWIVEFGFEFTIENKKKGFLFFCSPHEPISFLWPRPSRCPLAPWVEQPTQYVVGCRTHTGDVESSFPRTVPSPSRARVPHVWVAVADAWAPCVKVVFLLEPAMDSVLIPTQSWVSRDPNVPCSLLRTHICLQLHTPCPIKD